MAKKIYILWEDADKYTAVATTVPQPPPKPSIFVQLLAGQRESTFIPQGLGWTPNKHIDLLLLGEPKFEGGEVVTVSEWRSLGTLTVDPYGTFGYTGGAFKFIVQRNIPGPPPPWLAKPLLLVREQNSANLRFTSLPNDPWFTF